MLVTTLGVLILQSFKKHFFALLVALGIIYIFPAFKTLHWWMAY
jgi:hypothetical protein